ncbi:ABC transporter [Acetobacter pasteurianus]|uniref:Nitrate/sulfonate/bicarbonate transporter ATP-binding protein n=4 Tax=Acetobacter pasteurianus TaxID=438 RepID=C7JHT7_ACEP3|nr:ABC transporter ATP-binding protein [Acetobacter pasteurianus]BAU38437.1 nitrate/sulfonate/bicarbonate transporter ATP-binding protein [Acetobacter pasteurianus NBRC 101655]ASC06959.1 Lipoprotein-releasing system ATP-binding protein LolD [Acetobacter pasteurianus subsp. pasteurianus]CCT58334.1 ABC transporter [Acetobacter pasteurianus 386B]BAH99541.1 nitrate/sulfonate/bicarbonate transporter ATP-binding protein [Acetobacter pasteurianus IFO 3283-01]BAI02594.1 nitrate/sulfonate/bicarbonate t
MPQNSLPDYCILPPDVAERMAHIKQRECVLKIDHVGKVFTQKRHQTVALEDINFDIHRREFVCVVGPSGCGKSTLIRILAGLEDTTSGRILVDGQPVNGPGPDRGMVFQKYTLFPWMDVCRNVMFGIEMGGTSKTEARREAMQWLQIVGLEQFASSFPHQLSGGMQQRVAIVRALAARPRVLLMDESFSALDAQTRLKMQNYLMEIWRKIDITIVFITHDLDEAIYLADRILVLKPRPGRVEEVIEVPLSRPRRATQMTSDEFLATKAHLEALIRSFGDNTEETDEGEEDFNIPLLTLVTDKAE